MFCKFCGFMDLDPDTINPEPHQWVYVMITNLVIQSAHFTSYHWPSQWFLCYSTVLPSKSKNIER